MAKPSFENLHKNHKFAFLDGLLTGSLITAMVMVSVQMAHEVKALDKEIVEAEKTIAQPLPRIVPNS